MTPNTGTLQRHQHLVATPQARHRLLCWRLLRTLLRGELRYRSVTPVRARLWARTPARMTAAVPPSLPSSRLRYYACMPAPDPRLSANSTPPTRFPPPRLSRARRALLPPTAATCPTCALSALTGCARCAAATALGDNAYAYDRRARWYDMDLSPVALIHMPVCTNLAYTAYLPILYTGSVSPGFSSR